MKHLIRNAMVAVLGVGIAGLAGCEWGGGNSDNSWNDSNSIANFSGTYQGSGGYLVSDYTLNNSSSSSSGGSGGSTQTLANVVGENKGATPGGYSFAGTCNSTPLKPGSFRLLLNGGDAGQIFVDDGSGNLTGKYLNGVLFDGHGSINYDNGTYGIAANGGVPIPSGYAITINYTIIVSSGGGSGGSSSSSSTSVNGTSGKPLYAFNIQQTGNSIKIIDNNGAVYSGTMGDVRTTGNLSSSSQGADFVDGDQVSASFSVSGKSSSGMHVNLVGTFQGTASGVSKVSNRSGNTVTYTTSMALKDRRITGTWIEDEGKTGNISGVCPSAVSVSVSSTGTATN